jgi:hypothetical protein
MAVSASLYMAAAWQLTCGCTQSKMTSSLASYVQAEEKGTKVIDEDGLFALVGATTKLAGASQSVPMDTDVTPLVPPPTVVSAQSTAAPTAAAQPSGAARPSQPPVPLGGPKGRSRIPRFRNFNNTAHYPSRARSMFMECRASLRWVMSCRLMQADSL